MRLSPTMKGILLTPTLLKGAHSHLGHMRGSVKGELIPVTDANPVERFSLSQVNPVSNTLIRHSPFSLGAQGFPCKFPSSSTTSFPYRIIDALT
jgi:hypothetical protein